jgi:Cytochrome C oxidase, cbb3-type, subunit III
MRLSFRVVLMLAVLGTGCSGAVENMSPADPSKPGAKPESDKGSPGDPTPMTQNREPGGVRGILECPTVPLPAYGNASSETLSKGFRSSCAACHGGAGQGHDKYPAIPGKLTQAEYVSIVRKGIREMPAFDAAFIDDASLAADFDRLKKLALQPDGIRLTSGGPDAWTDADVETVYQNGLKVWRKPGSVDGQACTNCHSADGVELAIIGFTDDAILRRGQQHLSPEDALTVRDFVHAQRIRLGIAETCATDWRPFQPGGKVLPGATNAEQDAAFLKVLQERKLLLATSKIVTLADAKNAFAELQAIDLRQLPIGIPLPRWSEDKFNGPEHRDINDYMPPVPTVPNKPSEYFALEDAYLANPTDAGLYKILDENRKNMNDLGYAAKYAIPRVPSNCVFENSTQWIMERITQPKRLSVIVSAHLFREEIKNPGSFYRRPASPFADAPEAVNPAFFLGGFAIEPPCYDDNNSPNWIKSFPAGFREEFPESDLRDGVVRNATDRLTHVWMTLGQVLDPTLIAVDNMQNNKIHYWAFRNFAQNEIHLPFIYVHRIAMQTTYWNKMRGTPVFPKVSGPFDNAGTDWLHPLLATVNQESAGLQSVISADSKTLPGAAANQFKGNLIRMMMLLSRDLLQQGHALQSDQNDDHCLAVTCQTGQLNGYVDGLKAIAAKPSEQTALTAQGFDFKLYETDTRTLVAEVLALMARAPKK